MYKTAMNIPTLLLMLAQAISSQDCLNLYVNNTPSGITPTGSITSPFPDLASAFATVQNSCSNSTAVLYIANTQSSYVFQNSTNQGITIDYPVINMSMVGYSINSTGSVGNCDQPNIELSGGDLLASSDDIATIQYLSFSGLNFVKVQSTNISQSNLQLQTNQSLSLQNICIIDVDNSSTGVTLLSASSDIVNISNIYINGSSSVANSLFQITASTVSVNNIVIGNLSLTLCNDSVISISQSENFNCANVQVTASNFTCPMLNLETTTTIQLQNWTVNDLDLSQASLITIYYDNNTSANSSVEIDTLLFSNCPNTYSGLLINADTNSSEFPTLLLSNSQFASLSLMQSAIMINTTPLMSSIFTNCTFKNNYGSSGTAIYTVAESIITNCTFSDNWAQEGFGGAMITLAPSTITNCTFSTNSATTGTIAIGNNSASGGAIFALAQLTLVNCIFKDNFIVVGGDGGFGGAIFANTTSNLTNCTFANNFATSDNLNAGLGSVYGGGISALGDSSMSNCNFTNNLAASSYGFGVGGGVFSFAQLDIISSNFANNSGTSQLSSGTGGAIFSQTGPSVTLSNCSFSGNSAGGRFGGGGGGAIVVNAPLTVTDCSFIANTGYGTPGAAIFATFSGNIMNSAFSKNHAYEGGAIYYIHFFEVDGSLNVMNCTFDNNYADNGGGAVYSTEDLSATNCSFINNTASFSSGGAIYTIAPMTISNCNFTNNVLSLNSLDTDSIGGGAIYTEAESTILNSNFLTNSANTGGAVYALAVSNITNSLFVSNVADMGGAVYALAGSSIINSMFTNNTAQTIQGSAVVSGMLDDAPVCGILYDTSMMSSNSFSNNYSPFPFLFNEQIFNSCNATASSINPQPTLLFNISSKDSTIMISGCDLTNMSWASVGSVSWTISVVTNSLDCWLQPLPDDSLDKSIEITVLDNNITTWAQCSDTVATCTIYFPLSKIQFDGSITSISYSISYQSSTFPLIESPTFQLVLRNCDIGEVLSFSNGYPTCTLCPNGTYSLVRYSLTCLPCPANASSCSNGSNIYLYNDTWRSSSLSANILDCRVVGVCLNDNLMSTCYEGYTGPLCQACDNVNGYARSSPNKCDRCIASTPEIFAMASVLLVFSVICLMLYSDAMINSTKSLLDDVNSKENQDKIASSIYIRLLMTYSQIITIINMSIENFTMIGMTYLEATFNFAGNPISSLVFSNTCMFIKSGIASEYNIYYIDIVMSACLPFLLIAIITGCYACRWRFKMDSGKWYKLINIAICTMITSQPAVAQKLLSFFQCSPLPSVGASEPDTNSYIYSEMGHQCTDESYQVLLYNFVVPALLVWVVALPGILLYVLYKNRHNLDNEKIRTTMGMLLSGYRHEAYFWPIVNMLLKILLIVTSTLLYLDPKTNGLTICFVLYIYYMWFNKVQPYSLEKPVSIEQYCLFGYIMTIFLVVYVKDNYYESLAIVGIVGGIAINIIIVSILIYNLISAKAQETKKYASMVASIFVEKNSPKIRPESSIELDTIGSGAMKQKLNVGI